MSPQFLLTPPGRTPDTKAAYCHLVAFENRPKTLFTDLVFLKALSLAVACSPHVFLTQL